MPRLSLFCQNLQLPLTDATEPQRLTYFIFEEKEWELIAQCPSLQAQVFCALQIGYFKAKDFFFRFSLDKISQEDVEFIVTRYFKNQVLKTFTITKHEYYLQRDLICQLFGYRAWADKFTEEIYKRGKLSVKRDITPNFIARELLVFLRKQKIIRPGYTALQTIISRILADERKRLKLCLQDHLTKELKENLKKLIENNNTLSELAALKRDARNFKSSMMKIEREKHATLKTLYEIVKNILPSLDISQQNIAYYASLIHYYTISDLARFEEEQTYLYLVCYVFKRYQQINDNLVEAFNFNLKQLETEIKEKPISDNKNTDLSVGRLMLLYVDDDMSDFTFFAETRKKAFSILSKETIRSIAEKMMNKQKRNQHLQWEKRDKIAARYKIHVRPLFVEIAFESQLPDNPLFQAMSWMKEMFSKQKSLSERPIKDFPQEFISKRHKSYLFTTDQNNKLKIDPNRYEFLVYRQLMKQMDTGAIYVNDTINYKPFASDLVSLEDKRKILKYLDIPWFRKPIKSNLNSLFKEHESLFKQVNFRLKQGTLKHLKYDPIKKEIIWTKPRIVKEYNPKKQILFDQFPLSNISDVMRFVNEKTGFLSAFIPLQPRYQKQEFDDDNLIAVLIAQGENIGNYKMDQTSDVPYHTLELTYQQRIRLSTLDDAHDILVRKMMELSMFPHYTFDVDILYGAFDGQKFEAITPTTKARNSKKYFKKGRGIVAYTLLTNHMPIGTHTIGPHEPESYYSFDLWYNNKSLVQLTVLTGDMHVKNKANFVLFHWFGAALRPRLTNLKKELLNVSGTKDPSAYKKFLVKPVGQLCKKIILDEKENLDRIVASLALKDISQSILVRKLCHLSPRNKTRKAVFEYNKLIRDIYTFNCILNPQILVDVHRSQNRVEAYHNLRAAIAKTGGRKALLGQTDLEVAISNKCGRLLASCVIYHNADVQSCILDKDPHNQKLIDKLKKDSPVSWRHIHFGGKFTFYNKNKIDIDKIIKNIIL